MKTDTYRSNQALQWSSVIFVILAVNHNNMHSFFIRFAWCCACVGWYQWEPNVIQFMLTVSFFLYNSDGSKKTDDGFSKGSLRVRNATNTRLQYHLQEIQAELITAWGLRYRSLMNVHFIFQHSVWGLKHIGSLDWPPWIDLTCNMFRLRKELISPITVFPIPASKVLNCRASWDMGTGNTQLKTIKHTC